MVAVLSIESKHKVKVNICVFESRDDIVRKSGKFAIQLRTQFRFHTNDRNLNRILNGIADHRTNIAAYCQSKKNKVNSVKLVVGSPRSGNSKDNRVVRNVLRSLGVMFQEKKVIQILNIVAGVPGIIKGVYGALFRKVDVKAMYDGENESLIVSVSNIRQAIRILQKL